MRPPFLAPAGLLDALGISSPEEIHIEAIAQYCGVTVVYEPLSGCEARILGEGDRAIVTVNSRSNRQRQRFSAAHELGHWMRDRGKVALGCSAASFVSEWDGDNPERRANRYAADLLLPRSMFSARCAGMRPEFSSVRGLAALFNTSLTATAIRLVELGSYPSMIVCTGTAGRKWFAQSKIVPRELWPLRAPGQGSVAARLLRGEGRGSGPTTVDADDWIDHAGSSSYSLVEDSVLADEGVVLSLLWWKDERQILDLDDED